jgi:21S rRNA (GM2251-2'-O)-methyltransferase
MPSQLLYGINPVLAALTANKRTFYNLYMSEPLHEKHSIISKANELGFKFSTLSKEKLEKYAQGKPHQGVVLKASELTPRVLKDPKDLPKGNQLWVCLDQITDPQNLGSIIRASYFFNVTGVILPTKHTAPLSPAVSKVSSGAVEWLDIVYVADIPSFLSGSKTCGWKVVGAGQGKDIQALKASDNMILVFGNEGFGIRERVKKECEDLYWIPGGNHTIDSLNVGSAISVFLYKLTYAF